MIRTIEHSHIITIEIKSYEEEVEVPKEEKYVAWIKEPEYKGILVTGSSISDVMKELSISLKVLELYRLNS